MPTPLTIGLLSREFPPFFGGGIGTAMHALAHALAGAGHRVVVITVADDDRETRTILDGPGGARITVVRIPFVMQGDWASLAPSLESPATRAAFESFWPGSAWAMHVAERLPALVREFEIDVLEVPDTGALAWFVLGKRLLSSIDADARVLASLPIVTCLHSPTAWIGPLNREPVRGRAMVALAEMEFDQMRWSDALISPTRSVAEWASRHAGLDAKAISVIENAASPFTCESEHQHTASDAELSSPIVLFIGRLEYRKGIDTLLAAWRAVVAAHPSAELHLLGADTPDPERRAQRLGERLLKAMPAHARRSVQAFGKVSPSEVALRLRNARVVAVPSPDDNLPCTMIEAMAAGKVVVASRSGGMAEVIRDGGDGVLCEPSSSDALAAAIGRALSMSHAQSTAMRAAAIARAREVCDPASIAEHRLRVYESARERARDRCASVQRLAPRDEIEILSLMPVERSWADSLRAALEADPSADFAHGWTRDASGGVHAFATPSAATLVDAPRFMGPVAVRASVLRSQGIDPALRGWSLVRSLVDRGSRGRVVPSVLAAASAIPEHASEPSGQWIEAASPARVIARTVKRLITRVRSEAPR